MYGYKVKKLTPADLAAFMFIAEVHESLPAAWVNSYVVEAEEVEKSLARLVEKHKRAEIVCFVAEKDGEIVAFVWGEVSEQDNKALDIISLWTKPEHRGKGLATQLKLMLEAWAKTERKAEKIVTTVSAANGGMVQLNLKLGYKVAYHRMIKEL